MYKGSEANCTYEIMEKVILYEEEKWLRDSVSAECLYGNKFRRKERERKPEKEMGYIE